MKLSKSKAKTFLKHGAKITVYGGATVLPGAGLVAVEVNGGHYQEFYHDKSTFIYYIISGKGKFYLNGKKIAASSGDIVVAKPKTKIYYLGKMRLLLLTVPAWQEKYEHHVRYIAH